MRRIGALVAWAVVLAVAWTVARLVLEAILDAVGIATEAEGGSRADPKNPPGQFVATLGGLAIGVVATRFLYRRHSASARVASSDQRGGEAMNLTPGSDEGFGTTAGWHPDPSGRHELRYSDGIQWTDHVSDRGQTAIDPPETRPEGNRPARRPNFAQRHPVWTVIGVLVVVVSTVGFFVKDEPSRSDVIDGFVEAGMTRQQANCVADGFEDEFGTANPDGSDVDADGVRVTFQVILDCAGSPGMSDCFVDEFVEIVNLDDGEFDGAAVVQAANNLNPEDRVELVQASFTCEGATDEMAVCVTDAMVDEFGMEFFEQQRVAYTAEQEQQLFTFVEDCSSGDGA